MFSFFEGKQMKMTCLAGMVTNLSSF